MTVTEDRPTTEQTRGATGRVVRVTGPVVDVEFSADTMPDIYNALTVEFELLGQRTTLTLEVAQHLGDNVVRTISMQPTDGLVRGAEVADTGGPISVPVGEVDGRSSVTVMCAGLLPCWSCVGGWSVSRRRRPRPARRRRRRSR